jgi:hypothetical protein
MSKLIEIIISENPEVKNISLEQVCLHASLEDLLAECASLETFRHDNSNLYHRVRALFFLYAIHRFYIPFRDGVSSEGIIPYEAYEHMLNRRFEEAIDLFLKVQAQKGANEGISSGLADAYHQQAFQSLANQVKRSVRSTPGNQWMFRTGHPDDHPLKFRKELLIKDTQTGMYPLLHECTPVRMDLTHSGWSDIFFLGMDFPEGAKVLNISVDLCVRDAKQDAPKPPIDTYLRVIDEPVLRLTSIDLGTTASISKLSEVFDFAKDYLGLIKAAVIASGIVPPGMEGADLPLSQLLERLVGEGRGIELVSQVNNIPKGSRLAVSTNLLASLISLCMRATGQTEKIVGALQEDERRLVAAKAILGEWIGGSGGGWQDSGGVWPGMKLIKGVEATLKDPEFGVSKGRLLPKHTVLERDLVSAETRQKLQDSLVIVHGGMAQDVGPILEMVTEKYLLRSEKEWEARQKAILFFEEVVTKLKAGDVKEIGQFTQQNFEGPIQTIIPWSANYYTELLIQTVTKEFGDKFWGFWMMGGMSGGGMGFIFDPNVKAIAQKRLGEIMLEAKKRLIHAVPFAMEPVVYDFKINENGTFAQFKNGEDAILPVGYYTLITPTLLKRDLHTLTKCQHKELELLGNANKTNPQFGNFVSNLFERMMPQSENTSANLAVLMRLLTQHGFDVIQHSQIKSDLKAGRIGLVQNRLPANSKIEDVSASEVFDTRTENLKAYATIGEQALKNGELAIVSLAGGAGTRWTKGSGVVKSLNPFAKFAGKHRNFVEVHLAKSRLTMQQCGTNLPHIFTTSYSTHEAIEQYLQSVDNYSYPGSLILSPGRAIGLRLIPTERDLRFLWEETARQVLDEQSQKMQESLHQALINWAKANGEGEDYTDNLPNQCIHPVGHWYEVPNLFLNGKLLELITENPNLKHLFIHNIDTLGANADPAFFGYHIAKGSALTVEVISRKLDDRGGGLANVNGSLRLVEGLALPDEKIEFDLSYYNSNSFWVDIDQLLKAFKLLRSDLSDMEKVKNAVWQMSRRMPTYVTIKDVKKRWGKGQEDVFPITQFEKLWGDMTALPELGCSYMVVPRMRGQQLKEVSQLDGWLRDGSADYIDTLCSWED